MSELKCKVEKNAIPTHRLIGKAKLEALKSKFNGGGEVKTTTKSLTRLDKMASNRQKESQKIAMQYQADAKAKREAKKAEAEANGKKDGKTSKPSSK